MSNPVWIDVREADEFAGPHYKGSINISYQVIEAEIGGLNLAKDTDIRVYCRTGRRSGIAKDMLEAMGYTKVTNEGGVKEVLGIDPE